MGFDRRFFISASDSCVDWATSLGTIALSLRSIAAQALGQMAADMWRQILDTTANAQKIGAIQSIPTKLFRVRDKSLDINFIVNLATVLKQKPKNLDVMNKAEVQSKDSKPFKNPFLPPDPAMTVCELEPSHRLVLNKFNVVPNHILVVTRDFEPQSDPLSEKDMKAVFSVLANMPSPHSGLAFYNSGPSSGRSQPHKHIQIVPLPLDPNASDEAYPFRDILLEHAKDEPDLVSGLPFMLAACRLSREKGKEPGYLLRKYTKLKTIVEEGVSSLSPEGDGPISYNWYMTTEVMVLVPRSKENSGVVSINALGYAGTILVKSPEDFEFVESRTPLQIITDCGIAVDRKFTFS